MEYQTLYRRWRPHVFGEVVGQDHIIRTLQNALYLNRFSHAYLFCGPRGTGKTTTAKILAKALNCHSPEGVEPCNRCSICVAINEGRSIDVLEIDAASNRGIDEIRDLREKIRYVPAEGRYKIYIVDEVHMLTQEAFNALLKTLEEPPKGVVFILATTEPYKLPSTIISRCQRFDFHLITVNQMVGRMRDIVEAEQWKVEDEALFLLARQAEGGMRDCLGLLEQCRAYGQGNVTQKAVLDFLGLASPQAIYNLVESIIKHDMVGGFRIIQEIADEGKALHQFVKELNYYLSRLVILGAGEDEELVYRQAPGFKEYLHSQKGIISVDALLEMLEALSSISTEFRHSYQPQVLLELGFFKLLKIFYRKGGSPDKQIEELYDRLGILEEEIMLIKENISEDNLVVGAAQRGAISSVIKTPAGKTEGDEIENLEGLFQEKKRESPALASNNEILEKIIRAWPELLDSIKRQRVQTYAWLEPARLVSMSEDQLILSFGPEYSIHMENFMQAENLEVAQKIIGDFLSQEIQLKCISTTEREPKDDVEFSDMKFSDMKKEEEGKPQQNMKKDKNKTDDGAKQDDIAGPLLEGAVKLFKGHLLDVEEPEY